MQYLTATTAEINVVYIFGITSVTIMILILTIIMINTIIITVIIIT